MYFNYLNFRRFVKNNTTMESLTIYVKDKEKIDFLYQFLQHLDFVIMPSNTMNSSSLKQNVKAKEYDFFKSAGLWESRNITQDDLRARAWKKE